MAGSARVPWWVVLVAALGAAVVGGGAAWLIATAPLGGLQTAVTSETQRARTLAARVQELSSAASEAIVAADAAWDRVDAAAGASAAGGSSGTAAAKPSFTTYAYIRKLTGPLAETFTVYIDRFDILTGAAATEYAKDHGQTPPSNGILYVNESPKQSAYPLAQTATITAYTGGVEAMTPLPLEPGKLQQWAADPTVIPMASSDMWQVTVKNGEITAIKMVAVAD